MLDSLSKQGSKLLLTSLALALVTSLGLSNIFASSNTTLTQVILAGTLSIDIVDGSFVTVANPAVTMSTRTASSSCLTGIDASTGTLGTSTERIYIDNPGQADNGWVASIAASNPTDVWTGSGNFYDFNDATASGCSDSVDADSVAGQMTINPAVGSLSIGQCVTCSTTGVTLGSAASFSQGTVDNITVVSAAAGADNAADYVLEDVGISQTIPAGQVADSYTVDLVLSIVAI